VAHGIEQRREIRKSRERMTGMADMTGLERCMTVLRLEEPDRVPIWELIVNDPVVHALMGPDATYDDLVDAELDAITVGENQVMEEIDEVIEEHGGWPIQ